MNKVFFLLLSVFCAFSCSHGSRNESPVQEQVAAPVQEQVAAPVQKSQENEPEDNGRVLVSKGVIRSANEVNVFSRIEGQLLDVRLLEGQKVKKGQTLFVLDDWDLKGKVLLCESNCEQARVRMEEVLIGQGFHRDALDQVPQNIREYAAIKSGLNVAQRELEISRARLSRAVIPAPQSGLLTGIRPLPYSYVNSGETLCRIIDPDHLIVEFSILETELKRFSIGSRINVCAIAYNEIVHSATVRSIGTVVNESGMVQVEASLEDSSNLLPGMTAIVSL